MVIDDGIEFTHLSLYQYHALGVTKDGKLYGWGYNEKYILGFEN